MKKKYVAEKRIDGYYMVVEKKTYKPVSAMLYSTKDAAQEVANELNAKEVK